MNIQFTYKSRDGQITQFNKDVKANHEVHAACKIALKMTMAEWLSIDQGSIRVNEKFPKSSVAWSIGQ